ncbi:hypothetical protein FDUTEX481_09233 [Tolypothrix sp. PCC 7601]|nr:hypothetical protein FDUTEX481_09233 [Tolypothrix sp. PCC 7601]
MVISYFSPVPITPNPHSLRSWVPRVPQSPVPNPSPGDHNYVAEYV